MNTVWYVLMGLILLLMVSILSFRFWIVRSKKRVMIKSEEGIMETETLTIGGIPQCLCHRGKDRSQPVLLFLHGGPGSSMMPFLHGFQSKWEEEVTVVQYDQRSAGRTMMLSHPSTILTTNTFEQALIDLHEVVTHLKAKYQTDKILLMGYAYGAFLGHHYAKAHPENVGALFGVSPLVDSLKSDESQYLQLLDYCTTQHKMEDLNKLIALEPFPVLPYEEEYLRKYQVIKEIQHKYHLLVGMNPRYFFLLLTSPYMSFDEFQTTQSTMAMQCQYPLNQYLHEFSLLSQAEELEVPYYCLIGTKDFECPIALSEQFYHHLKAQKKQLHVFTNLGHTPFLENTNEFNEVFLVMLKDYKESVQ